MHTIQDDNHTSVYGQIYMTFFFLISMTEQLGHFDSPQNQKPSIPKIDYMIIWKQQVKPNEALNSSLIKQR